MAVECPKKGCGPWCDLGGMGVRRSQGLLFCLVLKGSHDCKSLSAFQSRKEIILFQVFLEMET